MSNWKASVARKNGFGEKSRGSVLTALRDAVMHPSGDPVGSWIFESGATNAAPLVHRWCVRLGAWGRHVGREWCLGSTGPWQTDSCGVLSWSLQGQQRGCMGPASNRQLPQRECCGPSGTPSREGSEFTNTPAFPLVVMQCFSALNPCSHHPGNSKTPDARAPPTEI